MARCVRLSKRLRRHAESAARLRATVHGGRSRPVYRRSARWRTVHRIWPRHHDNWPCPLGCTQCPNPSAKAFSSNGVGYLSNIVAALYYAVQHHANVVNMSFDLASSSPSLTQAAAYANKAVVVLVAAAGNEITNLPDYPAALNNYVDRTGSS